MNGINKKRIYNTEDRVSSSSRRWKQKKKTKNKDKDTLNRMGEDKHKRNHENNNTTDNSETHGGGRE